MNPQVLYTPQQQMGFGGYSVPCRVGNWGEDEYLGVLQTANHVSKETAGMLNSQQLSATLNNALAPVNLAESPADSALRFGDRIMLSAALGGVLALDSSCRAEAEQEGYVITRTSEAAGVACVRTAWTIGPPTDGAPVPEDGILRVGQKFSLSAIGADGEPLYLQTLRYTLHNLNYAGSGGQKQGAAAVRTRSVDTTWMVASLDPSVLGQMEAEGQPVPANTFVALKHANTHALLYSDATKIRNKYSGECEVSAFANVSPVKAEWGQRISHAVGPGNHWAFTTAAPASS